MFVRCAALVAAGLAAVLLWPVMGLPLGPEPIEFASDLDSIEPAAGEALPAGEEAARMPDLLTVATREIGERRQALDRREQDLTVREEALRDLARRLQVELSELQALRVERDAEQVRVEREEEERAMRLARLYETMKPKRAASIFDRTPVEEVASIARRMRDGKAAMVIQQMTPERASAVTARLAEP